VKDDAYLENKATNAVYGTISLIVNGDKVTTEPQLFKPGQTKVDLEWIIPKVAKQMLYNVQAQADLYDVSLITEEGKLNTFAKSQTILLSELKPIEPLTDVSGKVIAEPALLYASDPHHENLRFRVVDYDGHCIIGGSEDCSVQDSTLSERGGIVSVEHGEGIYRIKYSGPSSSLERFSITSVDPFPSEWTITLESIDDFIPQAFALQDTNLKVKYRTISETITVVSE